MAKSSGQNSTNELLASAGDEFHKAKNDHKLAAKVITLQTVIAQNIP